MRPPAALLLLAGLACGQPPPVPATDLAAAGPVRVGMTVAAVSDTLAALGLAADCTGGDKNAAFTGCRTGRGASIGLYYGTLAGRTIFAMRMVGATVAGVRPDSLAARWEARYGPPSALEAPAVQEVTALRHWYREQDHLYRVNLCGVQEMRKLCAETVFDTSPAAVAAHAIGEVWSQRDAVLVVCRSWHEVIDFQCAKREGRGTAKELGTGEVLRITIVDGDARAPAGARLLFETRRHRNHYRMWRRTDGRLYGIGCQDPETDRTCWEMVARYEPIPYFTAYLE